jgi:hypothetical protein
MEGTHNLWKANPVSYLLSTNYPNACNIFVSFSDNLENRTTDTPSAQQKPRVLTTDDGDISMNSLCSPVQGLDIVIMVYY